MIKKRILSLIFAAMFTCSTFANDRIVQLPGIKKLIGKEYAGYTRAGKHDRLFYWFVATHKPNTPIIVWSNGGPGYSSMYGFFDETGPYEVTPALTLKDRQHAWSRFANYLVIDQPADVGLSTLKTNQLPLTRTQGINQYYHALYSFLKTHPAYQHSPIILAGESYAGTYLPLLAQKILYDNKKTTLKINLKAIVLMSPWIDPRIQQSMDSTYAFEHGFITRDEKLKVDAIYQRCALLIKKNDIKNANNTCGEVDSQIQQFSKLHMANIAYSTTPCNSLLDKYMRQEAVLNAIHALQSSKFSCWSSRVNKNYIDNMQQSIKSIYNKLLADHIHILIFSGLNDAKDTNYLGVNKTLNTFQWPHKDAYLHAKTTPVFDHQDVIGYMKTGGGLSWVKVLNAGHMIPHDQPKVNELVKRFLW